MIMTNRLPKEYTEVEYIQNSGTQYIDTGFIPNYDKNIKIEIVTTPTVANRRYCLLSNYSALRHLSLELQNNKGRAYYNNGRVDKFVGTISTAEKNTYIFEYDATNKKYNFTVNNETSSGDMDTSGISGNSLLMFVDREKRFSTFSTPLQIYSVRIWEDNILIKDLIPCVRKSDDEVGMYDLANGVFLTNAGTGTFTAGNKVQVKVKKIKIKINETMKEIEQIKTKVNSTMAKVFNVLSTIIGTGTNITLQNTANLEFVQPPLPRGNSEQATAILPTGYTQLDYIESTGTQYINTGITADNTVEFDVTFNTSDNLSNSTYGCIFGSRQASVTNELQVTTYSDSGFQGTFRYGTGGNYNAYLTRLQKINVKLENNKYYVDDVEKLTMDRVFTNNYNIYIFALNNGGTVAQYGTLKLYKFKLKKNGSLVRNFVPCKNANNELGLYDLVSKSFFGNGGTGTFTAGNEVTVPTPDIEVPIHNVTGDVKVLVQNKNIALNDDPENPDANYTSSGSGTQPVQYSSTEGAYYTTGIRNRIFSNITQQVTVSVYAKLRSESTSTQANPIRLFNYNTEADTTSSSAVSLVKLTDVTTSWQRFSRTVTLSEGYNAIKASIYSNVFFKDFQIEYNSTATTYTPHQEQTYTFPLGTQRMFAGDYLADDGIHHVRKQVEWNGTESWLLNQAKTKTILFSLSISDMVNIGNVMGLDIKSNYFTPGNAYALDKELIEQIARSLFINIDKSRLNSEDLAGFKTWLSANPITVEYVLAEEEITPYTEQQQQAYDEIKQALSYGEQTNITGSSDEANPIFSVEAYQRN